MKILNKLTNKHLLLNKRRTIVTIIGIMLSTALMCGIGLLVSTFRDYAIREAIANSGDYFAAISGIPYQEAKNLQNDKRISKSYVNSLTGFVPLKEEQHGEDIFHTFAFLQNADINFLENYELKEGRYPKEANEIIMIEKTALYFNAKVGDTITISIGSLEMDGNFSTMHPYIPPDASFIEEEKQSYQLVGLIKTGEIADEEWYDQGYLFTNYYDSDSAVTLYIKNKKAKDIYDLTEDIKKELTEKYPTASIEISYNDSLLALNGVSRYDNIMSSMVSLVAIILALISIGCTIVIYNSFAISVMERKKQFGLFSSIGATKRQLRYTVFYEAIVVGTIGILLGILASFIGIGVVVVIMNQLLKEVFTETLVLTVYPIFLIIPLIFMVFVIFFSAYSPSRKASHASPINVIRGNDDIKINKKKIKVSRISRKLFGVEGEIALKNIKRNKKKYRITIISLVTSIVLFISFSSLLDKMINIDDYIMTANYDIYFSYSESQSSNKNDVKAKLDQILKSDEIEDFMLTTKSSPFYSSTLKKLTFSKEYQEYQEYLDKERSNSYGGDTEYARLEKEYFPAHIVALDDRSYNNLKKKYHLKEDRPLLINRFETITYSETERKLMKGDIFTSKVDSISLCDMSGVIRDHDYDHYHFDTITCKQQLSNIYMLNELPIGFTERGVNGVFILVNEKMYEEIYQSLYPNLQEVITGIYHNQPDDSYSYQLYIKAKDYDSIDEIMSQTEENDIDNEYYYENIREEIKTTMNMVLVIKILFYGFISLVTLIGVTSVFNTLNTSIQLRKKEFAMLRSMGLSPRGFNRMIIFESVFFGIKSLVIGIPISLIFIYLINQAMDSISGGFTIPFTAIGISIVAVFIIVLLTMWYATSKIKHDNILDAIREENI